MITTTMKLLCPKCWNKTELSFAGWELPNDVIEQLDKWNIPGEEDGCPNCSPPPPEEGTDEGENIQEEYKLLQKEYKYISERYTKVRQRAIRLEEENLKLKEENTYLQREGKELGYKLDKMRETIKIVKEKLNNPLGIGR